MSDNGTCACGTRMVPWQQWRSLTPEQRAEARRMGKGRGATTSECKACYDRRRYREQRTAAGHEVNTGCGSLYSRDDLLAELEHLDANWNQPMLALCREVAPRLGMKPTTLEQRLRRYGYRSRFDCAGNYRGDVAA